MGSANGAGLAGQGEEEEIRGEIEGLHACPASKGKEDVQGGGNRQELDYQEVGTGTTGKYVSRTVYSKA